MQAPHGPSQQALITSAMQQAQIAQVPYVSTHGTGTPLGDPIESSAIRKAMQSPMHSPAGPPDGRHAPSGFQTASPITLAAVKSLVGHTEGTAGLAGLLLAMSHLQQQTAAPLQYRDINPYVAASLAGWTQSHRLPIQAGPGAVGMDGSHSGSSGEGQHAAGTSSFAMSGVNAHAIVTRLEHHRQPRQAVQLTWRRVWNVSAAVVPMTHPLLTVAEPQVIALTVGLLRLCKLLLQALKPKNPFCSAWSTTFFEMH